MIFIFDLFWVSSLIKFGLGPNSKGYKPKSIQVHPLSQTPNNKPTQPINNLDPIQPKPNEIPPASPPYNTHQSPFPNIKAQKP